MTTMFSNFLMLFIIMNNAAYGSTSDKSIEISFNRILKIFVICMNAKITTGNTTITALNHAVPLLECYKIYNLYCNRNNLHFQTNHTYHIRPSHHKHVD